MIYAGLRRLDPCIVILLLLTIFGLVLRIYGLGYQSFWYDEGYTVNAALAMLDNGWPILPSGNFYGHGLLNTGLTAASMGLFGETEAAARLPSVLFGAATIPLVFFFTRRICDKKTALIASVLLTFSIVEIAWSRQARMYQLLQFFYILSLYCFYLFTQERRNRYLTLTILSTICAVLTHTFAFSLILIYLIYLFFTDIKDIKRYLSKDFLKRKQTVIFAACVVILLVLGEVFFNVFSRVWGIKMNYFEEYSTYLKEVFPIVFYMGIVGLLVMLRDNLKPAILLLLALVVPFYIICFHVQMLSFRYMYFLLPIFFLSCGYVITYISDLLSSLMARRSGVGAEPAAPHDEASPPPQMRRRTQMSKYLSPAFAVIILGLAMYPSGFNITPQNTHYLDWTAPQPDFKHAYGFINDNLGDGDVVIDTWPAVGSFYLNDAPDYWLAFDIAGTDGVYCIGGDESRDVYTNTPCIKDLNTLEGIVNESGSGWLVMEGLASFRLPDATMEFIEGNLSLYDEGSVMTPAGQIQVYGWNNGNN
ncbi:MAG: glycosyltransferase family 39 protein [Chloroflexota bacterium]|nr:glycosyltransferase family 39 protein [Chloroflexota bacterium]